MSRYRDPPSRTSRAAALAAVILVHLGLGALVLSSGGPKAERGKEAHTVLLDLRQPPPPPPPPPPPKPAARAPTETGTEGKRASPSPVVAPPPKIALPPANPLAAAPLAGTGAAPSSGAGAAGTGPGSGGSGAGAGGGGTGTGAGTGIGEDARLLSGGLDRRDYRRLRAFAAPSGRAVLAILIGPDGRVAQCSIRQSSGDASVDGLLCAILQPRMRWEPARDRSGRALTVGVYYTATWDRY